METTHDVVTKIHEYFKTNLNNKMFNNDSKFDIDLSFGNIYEKALALILQDKTIEVKTERDKWRKTGNIAIELMNRSRLSGLTITKADWWAQVLTYRRNIESVILIPVPKLKKLVKRLVKEGHEDESIYKFEFPNGDYWVSVS